MTRLARGPVTAVLAAIALSGCGASMQQATTYTAYRLTCCTQADFDSPWLPGTTVDLHLNAQSSEVTTVNPKHLVTITAAITGPYTDVQKLKQGGPAANQVSGAPLVFDDRVAPVAGTVLTIVLPPGLPTGLYNLALSWDWGGGNSAGAASIVRVGS